MHLALRDSAQSIALRHIFFAERAVAKPAVITSVNAQDFQTIAIIGGGLMGAGIAVTCLFADLDVILIECDDASMAAARNRVSGMLKGAVQRGKLSQLGLEQKFARLHISEDYSAISNADIAIEAVFEDLHVKRAVFKKISDHVKSDTLIATNTSYLDPQEIAIDTEELSRVIGLHFFSPAHIMKLVEIVQTQTTSPTAVATAFSFTRRLHKTGVLSRVCDGFIGNRMLAAYRRQADYLLADGAWPEQIDAAMRAVGLPMGPYELQDLTGLQIAWANRKRQASARDPQERYCDIADRLCDLGRLGQRSGLGWYRYAENSRTPLIDPIVSKVIETIADNAGINRQDFSAKEIQLRLLAILANEGAKIVEQGIAERDADVDVVQISGYGFPRWLGGPLYWASQLGADEVSGILQRVIQQSPNSWVLANRYSA